MADELTPGQIAQQDQLIATHQKTLDTLVSALSFGLETEASESEVFDLLREDVMDYDESSAKELLTLALFRMAQDR